MKKPSQPAKRKKKQAPKPRAKSAPRPSPATKAALRSETLFRRTFDEAPVGAAVVGLDFTFTQVNTALCQMLGYTENELLGRSFGEITHPDDIAAGRTGVEQLLTGKANSFDQEKRYLRKDGTIAWGRVSVSLVRDDANQPLHLVPIIQDITARKKAEHALQESEKRFQQIVAAVTDYIYTVRVVDGRAVETIHGQGCFAITGYKSEEFANDPYLWFRMVTDADRPMVERQARQILIGNDPAPIEHRIIHKNGAERWVKNTFVAHHDAHGALTSYEGLIQDITERKQTEEALRISEFRWKFAIEGAGDSLWDWDVTTNTVFYSKRWKEMLGYADHEIKNDLSEWQERIHPDDKAMVLKAAESHRTGKAQSYRIEHRFLCKDGSWKWILAHGMAVSHDAAGKPLRVIGRHTDITERKQAEEALRESEQRYANTLNAVNDGIWEWNVQSGTAYFSPRYYTMLGYADGAFVANYTNWRALIHPDDIERVEQDLRHSVDSGQGFAIDLRLKTKASDWLWCSTRGNTIERTQDGHALRMAGTLSDITQRKKAEEDLEQFFALVPDMVCIASADGYFLSLNDAWGHVLGYTKEELMAVPFAEFVHPDDRNATIKESASQRTGKPAFNFTNRYRAKDGTYRWLEWNGTGTNEKGIIFAAARDITEHKQAEEAMRESELRYRTLANSGQGLIWTSGLDKNCDYFNQTWIAFTGRRLEQELGVGWTEGVHPDDFAYCVKTYVTAFDRRERFSMDYRIRRHDGVYRWIQDDGSPRYDSQGNFLGYIGHCLDITERKLADEALRESEFTLRESQAIAGLGSYILDITTGIWTSSEVLNQLFGIQPKATRTVEEWVSTIHPDDQTMMATYFRDHVVGQRQRFDKEYRITRQDNQSVRWVHGLGALTFDANGQPVKMRGTIQDITEHKLANEALRLSEAQLRAMFDLASVGIAQANPQTRQWLRVNRKMCEITGYSAEELLKRNVSELTHPDDEQADREAFQRVLRGETSAYQKEKRYVRKDGTLAWVNVNVTILRDATDQPVRSIAMIEDITARKVSEEALRASESRFRGLFDLAVDGILIGSSDGKCIEMNQQLCILIGRTRDELLGKNINVLFTPEVLCEKPLQWALLEQGQPVKTVRPIIRPDGLEIIVEMHTKKMPDGSFQSFFHDVTLQKQALAALRASEERFRNLLQNVSTVAVQGYRLDGTTSYWNKASEQLYGYTAQEAIGQNLLDLIIPAEMRGGVSQAMRQMAETGQPIPAAELSLRRKDGSRVSIFSSHSIVQLPGQPAELFCIDIDLTERKQAEAAIRESEEKFAKVFHDAPVWIAITDLATGAYVDVNEEALRVSGFTREESINHTATELGWISTENRAYLVEQLQTHGQIDGMEMAFRTKDGRTLYGWFKGEKIILRGKPCLLTVTVETTERKRAEEALLNQANRHAAELEQRVQERTAELEATNKELEAFSYSVSHDLRAPLRAIDGFSAILNTDFMARLDKEGQRVLGIICTEAKRMGLLIDDLLTFSRMNRLPLQTGEINMTALTQAVFDECAPLAQDRKLSFKLKPIPTAQGDQPMVRQVLMNLIANAIKYTRPKPLAEIEIGGYEKAGEAVYYVKDNGVGFDQRYADKLFGVFQRLHTEDEFEGTGVGLALVQRVIHRHGGRVWAEAKVNEGATFYFTIPLKSGK